jgi:HK97 family phage major capsid protein
MNTQLRLKAARENYGAKDAEYRGLLATEGSMTEELRAKLDTVKAELMALDAEVKRFQELEAVEMRSAANSAANASGGSSNNEVKEVQKNFSFVRALNMAKDGKLEGFEKEMHEEAVKEYRNSGIAVQGVGIPTIALRAQKRDMTATGSSGAEGGYGIQTNVGGLLEALSPRLVLSSLGVTMFDNLVGNLDIPSFTTAPTAAWEGEVDTTAEVSPAQTKISFSPNRLAAFVDVSKQLLHQSSPSIEAYLQRFLMTAVAAKLQAGALHGSGSGEPAGLAGTAGIGSIVGGTNGAAPLWDDITGLYKEVAIDDADLGNLAYLTNPLVVNKLQNTPRQSSGVEGNFIMNTTNTLNGFNTAVSTSVSSTLTKGTASGICSAIFFGNWADMALASWGGIDILINPYTKGKEGTTEVILNAYLDANVLRPTSFAAMLDALPA